MIFLFLEGCAVDTPGKLGISQAEWDQYSPAKQQELMADYEQTEQRKKATVSTIGSGALSVRVSGGQMLLPPYITSVPYTPVAFEIREGECHKQIPVTPLADGGKAGKLEVCYQENVLYMDPSSYDPNLALGSLRFPYMPAWKRNFTYPGITSTGLLKLKQVNVSIKELTAS